MVYEYSTDDGMKMKSVEKTGSMHLLMYRRGPKNSPSTNSRTELSMFAGARGTHCWKVTHHVLGEEVITRSDPQHSCDLNQPAAGEDALVCVHRTSRAAGVFLSLQKNLPPTSEE